MTNIGQRLNGKVAFVTGAARGQGRSHALTLAGEGADLILLDSVRPIDQVSYAMPEHADLKETARLVEERGRRAVVIEADVRDESMIDAVADAVAELGRLDIVVANAGVLGAAKPSWELTRAEWDTLIDINLTGVWQTMKAALPHIIAGGQAVRSSRSVPSPASAESRTWRTTAPPSTPWSDWSARSRTRWRRTTSGSTRCIRPMSAPT